MSRSAYRGFAFSVALTAPGLTAAADLEFGEYLAAECTSCHRLSATPDANPGAIPVIAGWPAPMMIAVLGLYRDGTRKHALMQSVARGLAEDEVAALAAYFEQVEPPRANND